MTNVTHAASCLLLIVACACSSDEDASTATGGAAGSGAAGNAGAGGGAGTQGGGSGGAGTGGAGAGGAGAGGDTGSGGAAGGTASGGSGGGSGAGGTGGSTVTPNQSCTSPSPPFTSDEQMLVDLPADSWFTAPNTKIRPLCPSTAGDCASVVNAWSGGTFDPVHTQMLIFGGGHADYSGNEVYAFELAALEWQRLTDPSSDSYQNQDPLPDGKPVSRHTYDGVSYVVHADRMFVHGGSRWQDGSGTDVSWAFDPGTKEWVNRAPADTLPFSNCCDEASAYDPKSKRVYFHMTKYLGAYDWDQNTWVMLQDYGSPPYWPRYEVWGDKRGVMDQKRGLLWFFGSDLVLVYDVAAGVHVTDDWITTGGASFTNAAQVGGHTEQVITTGGGEIITGKAPGIDYDTAADDLVGWVGGAPWILDLDSRVWSRSGATNGGPAEPAANGTYGRFRYVPRLNVFVLVNSIDDDVRFYKHTARCGN